MKVTIEVSSSSELEKIILFFQTLKLDSIRIINETLPKNSSKKGKKTPKISKGDKSIDPTDLFGMWHDAPRNIETIRQQAWQRETTI